MSVKLQKSAVDFNTATRPKNRQTRHNGDPINPESLPNQEVTRTRRYVGLTGDAAGREDLFRHRGVYAEQIQSRQLVRDPGQQEYPSTQALALVCPNEVRALAEETSAHDSFRLRFHYVKRLIMQLHRLTVFKPYYALFLIFLFTDLVIGGKASFAQNSDHGTSKS